MKKIKTSMRDIRNGWRKVFRAGYCDLSNIFHNREPQMYNCGVYGWNCDIYCDYGRNIAITTGYRNMAGVRIPGEIIQKYDAKARTILDAMWTSETWREDLEANAEAFLDEIEKYWEEV